MAIDVRAAMAAVPELDRFLTVDEMRAVLVELAAAHPDLARLRRVGASRLGEPIEPLEISGDPPTPINLQAGCRFAGRCPFVFDRCHHETPRLLPSAPGHEVACHRFPATNA